MGATRVTIYWCRAWVDGGASIHLSKGEEVGEDSLQTFPLERGAEAQVGLEVIIWLKKSVEG